MPSRTSPLPATAACAVVVLTAVALVVALTTTVAATARTRTVVEPVPRLAALGQPSPRRVAAATRISWTPPLGWPLMVLRAFEAPAGPYGPGHRGVDLRARPGDAVRAPAPGVVAFAGPVGGRGVLVIDHGSLRTTLEPVRTLVAAGTPVRAGEIVATLVDAPGPDPACAANCLYWGERRGDDYIDPLTLLPDAPPRLLPVLAAASTG
jgi:murein DD-endopeptidase MepM/ murein hydrolase activator NlpD